MNLIFQVRLNVAIRKVKCVGDPAVRSDRKVPVWMWKLIRAACRHSATCA